MSAKGINLAEECKVTPISYPKSGVSSSIISMKNHARASFIVVQGSGVSACTVVVKASDDVSSSNTSAIAFMYYLEATSGVDILGARTSAGAAGFSLTSGSNQYLVAEVDASDLPSGKPYVLLETTAGSNDNLMSVVAVLSGSRFADGTNPSILA